MKLINDNFDDYFEGNAPKKDNGPYVETEEEREERELNETTIERRSKKKRIALVVGSAILLLIIIFMVRGCYYNYQQTSIKGIVTNITLKGTVFKTYEGTLTRIDAPFENQIKTENFNFSVTDDEIAKNLNKLKGTPVIVQLYYREYKNSLPWRGDSKFVIDSISTYIPEKYVNTTEKYVNSVTKNKSEAETH